MVYIFSIKLGDCVSRIKIVLHMYTLSNCMVLAWYRICYNHRVMQSLLCFELLSSTSSLASCVGNGLHKVNLACADGKPGNTAELFERVSQSIKVKRYSEALNDLNAAIEADPALSEAYYHQASVLRQICRYFLNNYHSGRIILVSLKAVSAFAIFYLKFRRKLECY